MKITKALYLTNGKEWRKWLQKNHDEKKEIWLIYYRKSSGKKRIPYNEAIEEALCFGWIDSTVKNIDRERYAHRWSKRNKGSRVSDMNMERIRRLIKDGRMTKAGMEAISHEVKSGRLNGKLVIPPDIKKELMNDPVAWNNYQHFPLAYKRIRIGWIDTARNRPEVFKQRLGHFIRMTKKNKQFGMIVQYENQKSKAL